MKSQQTGFGTECGNPHDKSLYFLFLFFRSLHTWLTLNEDFLCGQQPQNICREHFSFGWTLEQTKSFHGQIKVMKQRLVSLVP